MNLILEMLEEARDTDLLMSRMDCHVQGLHSIVLKNNNGKLSRCFLADKTHNMHLNINSKLNLPLGIHNHIYDIRLTQVTGEALNIVYKENPSLSNVMKYDYQSEIMGGKGAVYQGISGVEVSGVEKLHNVFMNANQLHTVYVPNGVKSSWLVEEGIQTKNSTELFQNGSSKCSAFKTPSSADEVREFVVKFFKSL